MKDILKILMLEDLEDDAELVKRVLRKDEMQFTLKRVDTKDEFIDALNIFTPDVVLSDHGLPQFNSIEALKICKEKNINIPFILVTGTVSEEFAVSCLKQGADDYILKTNLSRLPVAIQYALRQREYEIIRQKNEHILSLQNEELIKINQDLDSFVYSVSHNLRSPLASVLGLVELAELDHGKDQKTSDHYFSLIKKSILKLDETIKEILNYSRNGRSEVNISQVDLRTIIAEGYNQMNYLDGFSDTKKSIHVEGENIPVYSDAHRLLILISNLLSNAIKYRDHKKKDQFIYLTIIITPQQVVINIQDNGIGIHPDYLPNVYDMFYRATEDSDGAGLGLFIAKEIVDKLEGTINISSSLNVGSEITVKIPNKTD